MANKIRFLSGNSIKIIAVISMLIDHVGVMLFPNVFLLRAIGRLAMPLFAFAISEGCRYTKNKLRHFLTIFALGVVCQIVYFVFNPNDIYFSILFTFSFAILIIYSFQYMKKCLFEREFKVFYKVLSVLIFALVLTFVIIFCENFKVDYGFFGCILPLFATFFDFKNVNCCNALKKLDCLLIRALSFSLGVLLFVLTSNKISFSVYALFSVPLILLYNGKRGKYNIKYLFYVFYPLHLVILQAIVYLIY